MGVKILILGATGMLGHAMYRYFASKPDYEVYGTVRQIKESEKDIFCNGEIISGVSAGDLNSFQKVITQVRPDIVLNCIGIIKQKYGVDDYVNIISLNSLLPHFLAKICDGVNARFIHFSTDCVFDGKLGNYSEEDKPTADDLYGKTKSLGEVDYHGALTIRTSIIGHELSSTVSLVDWFLMQKISIKGYTNLIFSGLTTYELAEVLDKYVIPNKALSGLYQVSAMPISKFDLLGQIAKIYNKNIEIIPFGEERVNRSLNSEKFRNKTGFTPKPWDTMIQDMHREYMAHAYYHK